MWAADIGAREGENSEFEKYTCCFNKILVEADEIEAEKLKSSGFVVIDKAIGKKQDRPQNFYITYGEGCSSLLEPKKINVEFYTSGNTKRFDVQKTTKVSVVDLYTAIKPHTDVIHYLKIDTQGNEYDVLNGMGGYRPIIIKVETSSIELYHGQHFIEDISTLLRSYGYVLFHQTLIHRCSPGTHNSSKPFKETALPLHGDAYFMPDWNTQNGLSIINSDEKSYRIMMQIFNMSETADFILKKRI